MKIVEVDSGCCLSVDKLYSVRKEMVKNYNDLILEIKNGIEGISEIKSGQYNNWSEYVDLTVEIRNSLKQAEKQAKFIIGIDKYIKENNITDSSSSSEDSSGGKSSSDSTETSN